LACSILAGFIVIGVVDRSFVLFLAFLQRIVKGDSVTVILPRTFLFRFQISGQFGQWRKLVAAVTLAVMASVSPQVAGRRQTVICFMQRAQLVQRERMTGLHFGAQTVATT